MALLIVQKYEVSIDVSTLRVTDITGAYDATTNPTGWGTPNLELNVNALWFVVKRKASGGDEYFEPSAVQIVFDSIAANTKETAVDFDYLNDGVFEITVGTVGASLD